MTCPAGAENRHSGNSRESQSGVICDILDLGDNVFEPDALRELERLLSTNVAAWKNATGAGVPNLQQVSAFLRFLKSNDLFWHDIIAWSVKHGQTLDAAQLRAEFAGAAMHEVRTSEELLAAFPCSLAGRALLREMFAALVQREQSVSSAFKHEAPAATAAELEALVACQSPQSLRDRFIRYAAAETGSMLVRHIIEWLIVLAIIGILAAIAVPKLMYKGVSPEMN